LKADGTALPTLMKLKTVRTKAKMDKYGISILKKAWHLDS